MSKEPWASTISLRNLGFNLAVPILEFTSVYKCISSRWGSTDSTAHCINARFIEVRMEKTNGGIESWNVPYHHEDSKRLWTIAEFHLHWALSRQGGILPFLTPVIIGLSTRLMQISITPSPQPFFQVNESVLQIDQGTFH